MASEETTIPCVAEVAGLGISISYMGSKRHLARAVVELTKGLPDGPMLDAFSGMCAVGERLPPTRPLWTNDFLVFPALVAKCFFSNAEPPPSPDRARLILEAPFRRNVRALERRLAMSLEYEERFIASGSMAWAVKAMTQIAHVGTDERLNFERQRLERAPTTFPYRLASITYAGSFFGIKQCMEIDSLRFAIDHAVNLGQISHSDKEWLLIALGQVACRVNNSTGHFAEYLKPKSGNIHRIVQKRKRSVYTEFFRALASMSPIGPSKWRVRNQAFCSETLALLREMLAWDARPSVIYADPPYSKAQYARYYHVLDALVEYRYPEVSAEGRYPDKRPRTVFALKGQVVEAIDELIRLSADLGAALILSYPSNGLLAGNAVAPLEIMRRYYHHAKVAFSMEREHSTFGAANGGWRVPVRENIYVGIA